MEGESNVLESNVLVFSKFAHKAPLTLLSALNNIVCLEYLTNI